MARRDDFRPSANDSRRHSKSCVWRSPVRSSTGSCTRPVGVEYRWGGRERWGRAGVDCVRRTGLSWRRGSRTLQGTPAGYYELERQDDGSVRIECFGLRRAVHRARTRRPAAERSGQAAAGTMGATRVWLNTCSHDHPHALQNYLARGFKLIGESAGAPNPPRVGLVRVVLE